MAEDKKVESLPATIEGSRELAPTDFGDYAGAGFEDTRMEEQITPFLRMAQGLSPEVNPGKGEFIRGLALGQIFNTASREVYDGAVGLDNIICWKDYHYGMWIPRDLGSGYRGAIKPDDPLVRATLARLTAKYGSSARFKMPRYRDGRWSDNPPHTSDTNEAVELVETGQLYMLYGPAPLTIDNSMRAVVSFTSTALGAYFGYVTRHNNALWPQPNGKRSPAPIFAYMWHLSTFQDKNNKGEYFNWKLDLSPPGSFLEALYARRSPELFAAAREFYELIKAGLVKPDETAQAQAHAAGDQDEVPF